MRTSTRPLSLVACLLAFACHLETEPNAIDDQSVAGSVTVSPGSPILDIGGEVTLVARVENTRSTWIPGAAVKWSSSTPSVATVSAAGVVHALQAGQTTITAMCGTVPGTVVVTVPDPLTPIEVRITAASGSLFAGETRSLTAMVLNIHGQSIASASAQWSSSAGNVASVSAAGLVRGLAGGTTNVTATIGSLSSSVAVTVVAAPPLRISGSRLFVPGSDSRWSAIAYDPETQSPTSIAAQWSTSNAAVASVGADGTVTGGQPGVATISAVTASGTISADVTVRTLMGRIAFASAGRQIGLMNLDGTAPAFIPDFTLDGTRSVELSPAGTRVAFDCTAGVCWGAVAGGKSSVLDLGYDWPTEAGKWPSWYGSDDVIAVQVGAGVLYEFVDGRLVTEFDPIGVDARPRFGSDGMLYFECSGSSLCVEHHVGEPTRIFAPVGGRVASSRSDASLAFDTPNGLCVATQAAPACRIVLAHDSSERDESTWSPDGAYLAIARSGELWLMQANGENLVRLPVATTGPNATITSPSWSVRP